MASEITLSAAMRANLVSLQSTQAQLAQTQGRLSTGKKVNSALDNPTNFFAAAAKVQRAADLTARKDGLTEAVQAVNASNIGITGITALIETAKGILATASTTSQSGLKSLYTAFNTVGKQISTLINDSKYKGTNFLGGTTVKLDVLFNETGSNKLTITGFDAKISGLLKSANTGVALAGTGYSLLLGKITNISGAGGFSLTATLTNDANGLTAALSQLQAKASILAANLSIVNARLDFTTQTVNNEKTGADNLTLADTNEEGANLLSLQTRSQLGITSLSLASQANQAVLRLFP